MNDSKVQIVYRKVSDLIPYENNPRNNDDAVQYVAASIKEFGFKVPVIVDKDDVVVAGHTRLKAAKQLGIEEVPTITADDLDEDQIRAFRLADNKTAEKAGWNYGLLELELGEITMEMEPFGFGDEENSDSDISGYIDSFFESGAEQPKDKKKDDNRYIVQAYADTKEDALELVEKIKELGYEAEMS